MFVSRKLANPEPPVELESPDHILRATVRKSGVLLRADFDGTYPTNPRTNLMQYPRLDWAGMASGGSSDKSVSEDWAEFGTKSLKVVCVNNSGATAAYVWGQTYNDQRHVDLQPGKWYAVSVYTRVETDVARGGYFTVNRKDGDTGSTDYSWVTSTKAPNTAGSVDRVWAIFQIPIDDPPGTNYGVRVLGSNVTGEAVYFNGMLIEEFDDESTAAVLPYFDETYGPDGYRFGNLDSTVEYSPKIAIPINPLSQVRFVRNGDQPVRSGDTAEAPDGVAYAYDMEAPLGVASTWVAYPVFYDGTIGEPSQGVTLITTEPDGIYDTWIKSIDRADLSLRVLLTKDNIPEFVYPSRNNVEAPQGGYYPVGSADTHTAPSTTLTAYTSTNDEEDAMLALLRSGTLLFQTRDDYHVADFYFLVNDFSDRLTGAGTALASRRWTIPVQVVARPGTVDAPFVIPGESYDDMPDRTYDQEDAAWTSYDAQTEAAAI